MFVVFDLDGTLADITHRLHHINGPRKDYAAFFAACTYDAPNVPVINTLKAHIENLDRVEIWSARSDEVRTQTEEWLAHRGINPLILANMRSAGDYTRDVELKRSWLRALHPDERPDIIYDDRQSVVDMWREEGVTCFQVAADWESKRTHMVPPIEQPLLTIMVGPSGAGKTAIAKSRPGYLSSDDLRVEYTGTIGDQSRNEDVFLALHRIARTRLECGLPVTIDATNLRRKDRLACVDMAPAGVDVQYVVVDRPLHEKQRDAGWRADVLVKGRPLIEVHHERFQSQLADILAGDGRPNVSVVDMRSGANLKVAA